MAYTTVNKSTDYFNTKLYTGNGSTNAITGVGFQPDWNWIKCRSHADSSQIFDVLRTTYALRSDGTNAEAVGNGWTSLDSDGFTLNGDSSGGNVNNSGRTYASWNWKANGAGSSNTDGSISSTVSASATSGFSIVKWTGSGSAGTIGHGLGSGNIPKMIIVKNLSDSVNWMVYHNSVVTASATNKSFMTLNTTDALGTNGSATTFTSVSDTTFGVGTDNIVNGSGDNMIAYCFAEKAGYSKFGSYVGNGNADGSFCYLGFKPAWVMLKKTNNTESWLIMDNKRQGYNPENEYLIADLNNAEGTPNHIDLLSNGFKLTSTGGGFNGSGDTFIYMAFGQSIVGSNNVPCTAR